MYFTRVSHIRVFSRRGGCRLDAPRVMPEYHIFARRRAPLLLYSIVDALPLFVQKLAASAEEDASLHVALFLREKKAGKSLYDAPSYIATCCVYSEKGRRRWRRGLRNKRSASGERAMFCLALCTFYTYTRLTCEAFVLMHWKRVRYDNSCVFSFFMITGF